MQIKLPKSISDKGDRSFALCIELATAIALMIINSLLRYSQLVGWV